ncbi:MAG TPA: Clp protease N-terminal domain-containing protein [Pseudonocardiaceae bacterium]
MFERFTKDARETVVGAQSVARRLGHAQIGTEHLLLSMLERPDGLVRRVLGMNGLRPETVETAVARHGGHDDGLDADALRAIGIDLEAVREKVERAFGPGALSGRRHGRLPGHIPFTPRAKKVLELSLREAIRLKDREINDGHILLGVLRQGGGLAAKVMTDAGVDLATLREQVETELD